VAPATVSAKPGDPEPAGARGSGALDLDHRRRRHVDHERDRAGLLSSKTEGSDLSVPKIERGLDDG
jgi:hypothetical protein